MNVGALEPDGPKLAKSGSSFQEIISQIDLHKSIILVRVQQTITAITTQKTHKHTHTKTRRNMVRKNILLNPVSRVIISEAGRQQLRRNHHGINISSWSPRNEWRRAEIATRDIKVTYRFRSSGGCVENLYVPEAAVGRSI